MLRLVKWYEISLIGEYIQDMGCTEEYAEIIGKFSKYETTGSNEHEKKNMIGLSLQNIKLLRKEYARVHGLPIPENITTSDYWKSKAEEKKCDNGYSEYSNERQTRRLLYPFTWKHRNVNGVLKRKEGNTIRLNSQISERASV